jgi:hypothetical protein
MEVVMDKNIILLTKKRNKETDSTNSEKRFAIRLEKFCKRNQFLKVHTSLFIFCALLFFNFFRMQLHSLENFHNEKQEQSILLAQKDTRAQKRKKAKIAVAEAENKIIEIWNEEGILDRGQFEMFTGQIENAIGVTFRYRYVKKEQAVSAFINVNKDIEKQMRKFIFKCKIALEKRDTKFTGGNFFINTGSILENKQKPQYLLTLISDIDENGRRGIYISAFHDLNIGIESEEFEKDDEDENEKEEVKKTFLNFALYNEFIMFKYLRLGFSGNFGDKILSLYTDMDYIQTQTKLQAPRFPHLQENIPGISGHFGFRIFLNESTFLFSHTKINMLDYYGQGFFKNKKDEDDEDDYNYYDDYEDDCNFAYFLTSFQSGFQTIVKSIQLGALLDIYRTDEKPLNKFNFRTIGFQFQDLYHTRDVFYGYELFSRVPFYEIKEEPVYFAFGFSRNRVFNEYTTSLENVWIFTFMNSIRETKGRMFYVGYGIDISIFKHLALQAQLYDIKEFKDNTFVFRINVFF